MFSTVIRPLQIAFAAVNPSVRYERTPGATPFEHFFEKDLIFYFKGALKQIIKIVYISGTQSERYSRSLAHLYLPNFAKQRQKHFLAPAVCVYLREVN